MSTVQRHSHCRPSTAKKPGKNLPNGIVVSEYREAICAMQLRYQDLMQLEIVSYCRKPRGAEAGVQWSVGSRIVGVEVEKNESGEAQHTCWVICDGIPVCVSTDKIRPCTASELSAYHYMAMQNPDAPPVMRSDSDNQQSFLDARPLAPTDVEMPELTTEDIDALDLQD
eukprot:3492374-Karenia_brevis.AAC.1